MKKFNLVDTEGEVINVVDADDCQSAIVYFSQIKNLSTFQLLKIFKVIENK
jgi:hypothetical protein